MDIQNMIFPINALKYKNTGLVISPNKAHLGICEHFFPHLDSTIFSNCFMSIIQLAFLNPNFVTNYKYTSCINETNQKIKSRSNSRSISNNTPSLSHHLDRHI